jgi:hypothetical protein
MFSAAVSISHGELSSVKTAGITSFATGDVTTLASARFRGVVPELGGRLWVARNVRF